MGANPGKCDQLTDCVEGFVSARYEELAEKATLLADTFWEAHSAFRSRKADWADKGKLGVRVRRREGRVYIIWLELRYPKNGDGKRVGRHRDIAKGRGNQYNIQSLCRMGQEWEAELVRELEPQFAEIRKELNMLSRISLQVKAYERQRQKQD